MKRLDEIEARLKAATPGPWQHKPAIGDVEVLVKYIRDAAEAAPGSTTFSVVGKASESLSMEGHIIVSITGNGPTSEANADLIAWAPCAIGMLLGIVRRIASRGCDVKDELRGIHTECPQHDEDPENWCDPCRVRKELEG